MARYIDAERLKRTFASGIRVYDGKCTIYDVLHNIENEPTADAVEVCRCEKCKHWKKYENTAGAGYCLFKEFSFTYGNGHIFNPITMPTHFCGYGERRDT